MDKTVSRNEMRAPSQSEVGAATVISAKVPLTQPSMTLIVICKLCRHTNGSDTDTADTKHTDSEHRHGQ